MVSKKLTIQFDGNDKPDYLYNEHGQFVCGFFWPRHSKDFVVSGKEYARRLAYAKELVKRWNCYTELLEACNWARDLYDQLALGPLEAAAKYGPDYEPPSDKDWLNMRTKLEQYIAKAEGA